MGNEEEPARANVTDNENIAPTAKAGAGKIAKKKDFASVRVDIFEQYVSGNAPSYSELGITAGKKPFPPDMQIKVSRLIQAGITALIYLSQIDTDIQIRKPIQTDVPFVIDELVSRGHDISATTLHERTRLYDLVDESNAARRIFFERNVGLAILLAQRERNHKDSIDAYTFEEIREEAKIGLLFAIDKYDPESGYMFSTYATHWIRQKMLTYLDEKKEIIRMSTPMNSIFKNIKFAEKELRNQYCDDSQITNEVIYEWLSEHPHGKDISLAQINDAMSVRKETTSLDAFTTDDGAKTVADVKASDENVEEESITAIDSHNGFEKLVSLVSDVTKQNILRDWYSDSNDSMKEAVIVSNLSRKYGMSKKELRNMKSSAENEIAGTLKSRGIVPSSLI